MDLTWSLISVFRNKILCVIIVFRMRTTCPAHLILRHNNSWRRLQIWSSSLLSFISLLTLPPSLVKIPLHVLHYQRH
jgi:hypothetical protein